MCYGTHMEPKRSENCVSDLLGSICVMEHIWNLKDQKIAYQIKWRKIKQARSYSNVSKRCNLCLWEKFFILRRPEMSTLNSRNELVSGCRHARKFLLKNVLFC